MKRIISLTLIFGVVFLTSCKDDDPSVDPREGVVGRYQMDDLTGSSTPGGNFVVQTSPTLEVEYEPTFKKDEIYLDMEPFVESILKELTYLQFNTRDILRAQISRDEQLATIRGGLFELKGVQFITTYTSTQNDNDILVCEMNLSGDINGSVISFDFDLLVIGQNISYTIYGSSSGSIVQ